MLFQSHFKDAAKNRNTYLFPGVQTNMTASQLRLWLAAPMASLFLVLSLCAFAFRKPESEGIYIPVLRLPKSIANVCCVDGRSEFVQLLADGRTKINEREIPSGQLGQIVSELMQNRAERVIFVIPDSSISYERFIQALDTLQNSTEDLHIAVVSGTLLKDYARIHAETYNLIWPKQEFRTNP